jgi:RHS repeat-associated protein
LSTHAADRRGRNNTVPISLLAPTDYLQDDLNQVTSREIPDDVDIMGYGVSASSTVTVDGYTADRWQKYFDQVLGYDNSTDPVYDEFVVAETGQSSYDRAVFLPEDEEEFAYDADGNLTQDGKWTYTWDAENRLATMETRSDLPMLTWGLDFLKIEFDYDYLGRRVQKRVYKKIVGNPGGPATQGIMEGGTAATTMVTQDSVEGGSVPLYTLITSRQYVWDDWLCIAELIDREELKRSHTWGVDLSGSQQGVGGVGGLVFLLDRDDTTDEVYHCFYDGNGNLMSLRDDSQAIAAQYDYGPFGELLTARGEYAAENPYRFSTKYVDAETGLHYYGYRYYNSSTGRWISRDPITEKGGLNLYGFVTNAPSHTIDALGLWKYVPDRGVFTGTLGPSRASSIEASSSFEVSFDHDASKFPGSEGCEKECAEIRFVQAALWYCDASGFSVDSKAKDTWFIDAHEGARDYPFYPFSTGAGPKNPTVPAETGSTMTDTPDIPNASRFGIWQTYYMWFETCAVCSKGPRAGDVYGCLRWGHYFRLTAVPDPDNPNGPPGFTRRWMRWVNDVSWRQNRLKTVQAPNVVGDLVDVTLGGAALGGTDQYRFYHLAPTPPKFPLIKKVLSGRYGAEGT